MNKNKILLFILISCVCLLLPGCDFFTIYNEDEFNKSLPEITIIKEDGTIINQGSTVDIGYFYKYNSKTVKFYLKNTGGSTLKLREELYYGYFGKYVDFKIINDPYDLYSLNLDYKDTVEPGDQMGFDIHFWADPKNLANGVYIFTAEVSISHFIKSKDPFVFNVKATYEQN